MNRIIVAVLAVFVAVGALAFTAPKAEKKTFDTFYWRYNTGSPLAIGSYSQITSGQYAALHCSSGSAMCGIVTNTTSPTLTNDGSGFPAVNSTVTNSDKKNP